VQNFAERLVELLHAPMREAAYSWESAEEAIGTPLPSDYKDLIDRIGTVEIDEILTLFGPDAGKPAADIARLVDRRERAWDEYREVIELPERFFRKGRRLIAFAAVDANYFFWDARDDAAPDDWGVVIVDADLDAWHEFDLSATECLYSILVGEIRVKAFADYFDEAEHTVERFGK
jgi:hypothetical protein